MHALAIHGLRSTSPTPTKPSSVWTSTTMSSWAELVAEMSRSGSASTWQSIFVIFIAI